MQTNLKKAGTLVPPDCAFQLPLTTLSSIPVRVAVYPGMPHAFWIFPELTTTRTATQDMIHGARWLISEAPST